MTELNLLSLDKKLQQLSGRGRIQAKRLNSLNPDKKLINQALNNTSIEQTDKLLKDYDDSKGIYSNNYNKDYQSRDGLRSQAKSVSKYNGYNSTIPNERSSL